MACWRLALLMTERVWLRAVIRGDECVAESPSSVVGRDRVGAHPMTLEYHSGATLEGDDASVESGRVACVHAAVTNRPGRALRDARVGVNGGAAGSTAIAVRSSRLLVVVCSWGRWVRCPARSASWTGRMWVAQVGRSLFAASGVAGACGWLSSLLSWAGSSRASGGFAQSAASIEVVRSARFLEARLAAVHVAVPLAQTARLCRAVPGAQAVGVRSVGVSVLKPHCLAV